MDTQALAAGALESAWGARWGTERRGARSDEVWKAGCPWSRGWGGADRLGLGESWARSRGTDEKRGPGDISEASSPGHSGAGFRGRAWGLRAAGCPRGSVAEVSVFKASPGKFLESPLQAALGVIFVCGQLSGERRPCVLAAEAAEPVMARAQPPTEGPRAQPGP